MYLQSYIVEGAGRFPLDMLRYDQSFPYSSEETAKIEQFSPVRREVRLMRFVATKKDVPETAGRWTSFGWSVKEVQWHGRAR
jgi:hypothetical protein